MSSTASYWCYRCTRFVRVWPQDALVCPYCDAGFLEEIDSAPPSENRHRPFPPAAAAMYMLGGNDHESPRPEPDQSAYLGIRRRRRNAGDRSPFNPVIVLRGAPEGDAAGNGESGNSSFELFYDDGSGSATLRSRSRGRWRSRSRSRGRSVSLPRTELLPESRRQKRSKSETRGSKSEPREQSMMRTRTLLRKEELEELKRFSKTVPIFRLSSTADFEVPPPLIHDSNRDDGVDPRKEEEGIEKESNDGKEKLDLRRYLRLYKAALAGEWERAEGDIKSIQGVLTTPITERKNTVLHVAVQCPVDLEKNIKGWLKRVELVDKVVQGMPKDALAMPNAKGNTALHLAALAGFTAAVRILVREDPGLTLRWDGEDNVLPIHYAAQMGHRDTYLFLLDATIAASLNLAPSRPPATRVEMATNEAEAGPFRLEPGARLVILLILAELYDLALDLVMRYPVLARTGDRSGKSPLEVAARKPSSFASTQRLNLLQRFIYFWVPLETSGEKHLIHWPRRGDLESIVISGELGRMQLWFYLFRESYLISGLQMILEKSVTPIKRLRKLKVQHHQMRLLVKHLCEKTAELDHNSAEKIFERAISTGAERGILEVVEEIAKTFPDVMQHRVFTYAVKNRHEKVFNLLHRMSHLRHSFRNATDEADNHILHIAAKVAPPHRLQLIPGAALQMQRELQWFKEVERLVGPTEKDEENNQRKTADAIFAQEHKGLVIAGEKWMIGTATSCSLVATLIATVAFAAALTVPGGNDQSSGHPIFVKQWAFMVFMFSNAMALFSSTSSILMFLSILTARYEQGDFLVKLPRSLVIGLLMLFISITSMIVAFVMTMYLALRHDKGAWILWPVGALAAVPISFFGFLQVPLLWDVFMSTYGPSIFHDPDSHRPFY